ncbi:protein of unknown function [Methylocaldum szegediense]|uniref:Uncharacterized protein n=1 Tax=Methylocaldum szegediense TaxID=73780 RepID=A0ABM9I1K0_9GAMM|nr:protein of unknown function [Methylocaldum szegediense]
MDFGVRVVGRMSLGEPRTWLDREFSVIFRLRLCKPEKR